ncbi:Syringolide-induced protein [Hirschfeldia incana]|nr:Syringolide-induced protein [Hirschfeldia incana]
MENNNNNSKNLSKMLQKALTIGHGAAPFSPVRDYRHHRTISTASRGYFFSSPITPLLPTSARARRRTKSSGVVAEPTSPKVSCIGQIKLAKSKCPEKRAPKNLETASSPLVKEEGKGGWSKLKRLFSPRRSPSRKSSSTASTVVIEHPVVAVEAVAAPSLGEMKRFATSRETLGGFDWKVEMKRQEEESRSDHRRGYSSDDEEEVVPCSVSMPLSQRERLSLCPRRKSEVSLWERRTMDRPKPLQVKPTY